MRKVFLARMTRSRRLFWGMIFTILITGGMLGLGLFLFTPGSASANQILPVSLHSPLAANYAVDERGLLIQPVDLAVAAEAARDRRPTPQPTGVGAELPTGTPVDPLPTLIEILKTPVPTVTPQQFLATPSQPPAWTATPQASATRAPAPTNGPSPTPLPSGTATATPSANLTALPTRTATASPVPTNPGETPTRTSMPPTNTPVVVIPSNTPVPPTRTPPPPPTNTSVPPTVAPTSPPPPTAYPHPTDPPPPPPDPTAYP